MRKNTLTAELQLYKLLMKHLDDSTRPQLYPKAVVDFAEFVRREAENDLDHAVFLEGVKHTSSAMAEIFYKTRSDEKRSCSPALVDFACRVYEEVIADEFVSLAGANRILIEILNVGTTTNKQHGWFKQVKGNKSWLLRSTRAFEKRFGLSVSIEQKGGFYLGYV
jgi:hypothetical protein